MAENSSGDDTDDPTSRRPSNNAAPSYPTTQPHETSTHKQNSHDKNLTATSLANKPETNPRSTQAPMPSPAPPQTTPSSSKIPSHHPSHSPSRPQKPPPSPSSLVAKTPATVAASEVHATGLSQGCANNYLSVPSGGEEEGEEEGWERRRRSFDAKDFVGVGSVPLEGVGWEDGNLEVLHEKEMAKRYAGGQEEEIGKENVDVGDEERER